MHFTQSFVAALPLFAASVLAAPHPGKDCSTWPAYTYTWPHYSHPATTTPTPSTTSSAAPSSTSVAPITTPTGPYGLISARSASPIHLQAVNARGQLFYIGGETASYCPDQVAQIGACPPGTDTAFVGFGALDVEVPGGQLVYVAPDGSLGFTQAHSASYPLGAVLEPFTYSFTPGASFGYVSTNAFNATGFMACPNNKNETLATSWQVFAALQNATVPTGNVSDCLGFDALAPPYSNPNGTAAAWQYT